MNKSIVEKARETEDYIKDIRNKIHMNPELGYLELDTASLIKSELERLGVSFVGEVAYTGVLASISKGIGKTILLRADMDALPIQEETNLKYKSKNPGIMHACGHDAHVAMLMGAVKILNDEDFSGTIKFLFQPSEEGINPDVCCMSGAEKVLEGGYLNDVNAALALHQAPNIQSGFIALEKGNVMASSDLFEIVVYGKSAHAGVCPENGKDAINIANQLINSIQAIVSREVPALDSAVISICKINGGDAANIVPNKVTMEGTIRCLNDELHTKVVDSIKRKCKALALMYCTDIIFKITHSLPITINDSDITDKIKNVAKRIFGANKVYSNQVTLGGDDFSFISQKIPSCFIFLGTSPADGSISELHTSKMCLNEDVLYLGSALLAEGAMKLL
ncbi:amidohydrolase [Marinilabiliaceae bacterium JC040]|nr:amidohydrolase [Marinilabiliaceae bacterium JC040]